MAKIALIGDLTTHEGAPLIDNPPCHVKVGGIEIALDQCHVNTHMILTHPSLKHTDPPNNPVTATGKVTIKGIKVVMHGDAAACGATVIASSKASTS